MQLGEMLHFRGAYRRICGACRTGLAGDYGVEGEGLGRLFRWTPETVEGQGVDAILEGVGALTEIQRIAGSKVASDRVA